MMIILPNFDYRIVLLSAVLVSLILFLAQKLLLNWEFLLSAIVVFGLLLISLVFAPLVPIERFIRLHKREDNDS